MDACSRNSVPIANRTFVVRPLAARQAVWLIVWCALLLTQPAPSLFADQKPNPSESDRQMVAEVLQQITAGRLDEAAARLRQLDDAQAAAESEQDVDLTFPLARLARVLEHSDNLTAAAELYGRAVAASGRPAAEAVTDAQRVVLRLNAASLQLKVGQLANSLASLKPICESPKNQPARNGLTPNPAQHRLATQLLLSIGAAALAKRDAATAAGAYDLASNTVLPKHQVTVTLGAAWSATLDVSRRREAAEKLSDFAERFPEHSDAPQAVRVAARCWAEVGESDASAKAFVKLLRHWPQSDASIDYVQTQSEATQTDSESAADQVQPEIGRWLIQFAQRENPPPLKTATLIAGLIVTAQEGDFAGWKFYSTRLASQDITGQATADVLHRLSQLDLESDAERLSTALIAPGELDVTASAREAACRWAGRTERWTILAMASQAEPVAGSSPTRTVAVERLFAESLMQTGRPKLARQWWEHLVDEHDVGDFMTLLRCAETATALAKSDAAATRIEAAREAAGGDAQRLALTDMLSAELAIRRLRFDESRALLEQVVRGSETSPALRGRAQWLIGESYFLQEEFAQAIQAYRVVEGIDSSGTWTAAALVQAGKSFEQLGRTREAAVCYWNLVNRFGDSVHARVAQNRLAAIAPDSSSSTETLRR